MEVKNPLFRGDDAPPAAPEHMVNGHSTEANGHAPVHGMEAHWWPLTPTTSDPWPQAAHSGPTHTYMIIECGKELFVKDRNEDVILFKN